MIAIDQTAINLAVAAILVGNAGLSRNWRQRLAGLRTDILVAIGAVSLVIFAAPTPPDPRLETNFSQCCETATLFPVIDMRKCIHSSAAPALASVGAIRDGSP